MNINLFKKTLTFSMVWCLLSAPFPWCQYGWGLSIDQETKLGEKFLAQIKSRFEFLDDDFANDYLNQLGHYLAKALETKPFPLRFYILKDNELNAFAGPGGHIFFFSGLVDAFDNLDQLGAVLCHEMGHIAARHLSERIQQAKRVGIATLAGILAGILIGGEGGEALISGSVAAGIQAQLHYSREDERQADQLSFKYMTTSCLNPGAMIDVLKKFHTRQWTAPNRVPPYLLTHPTGPERMANLDSMLKAYRPCSRLPTEVERFRRDFSLFKAVVRAKCFGPEVAEAKFKQDLSHTSQRAAAHFGLGIVYAQEGMFDQALEQLNKALTLRPHCPIIMKQIAKTHILSGNYLEAKKLLKDAARADPRDSEIQYLFGEAYQNLGKHSQAIELFERLLAEGSKKEKTLYNLGISYGRLGQLPKAHYYFGLFFKEQGASSKAKFHFQKALEYASSDPVLRAKILKLLKEGKKD